MIKQKNKTTYILKPYNLLANGPHLKYKSFYNRTPYLIFKKEKYKIDGLIFKNSQGLRYYNKLKKLRDAGCIDSFNINSLLKKKKVKQLSKYNAKKIEINDIKFDSMLESDYYLHLLDEKKKGNILDFEIKPSFILQPSFKKNNKTFTQIKYIADFKVISLSGEEIIVDTKGVITPDFKIKLKLFEYHYPNLSLKVVKYVEAYGGWIEYNDWLVEKNKRKKEKNKKNKK
ncbi:DUF1064 domain-containing protein [Bacillus mexicanus]|uniref:DUF1064 domain-containing protein n=1 Tax=Bacillus mexicanus TaxID=2834415 RepID=UPI003D209490